MIWLEELFTQGLRFIVRNHVWENFYEIAFERKAANRLAAGYFEICHEDGIHILAWSERKLQNNIHLVIASEFQETSNTHRRFTENT